MNHVHEIRDRYVKIINDIPRIQPRLSWPTYHICPDATFAECLKYTRDFVVGKKDARLHYRYDIYRKALRDTPIDFKAGKSLVHVDVGCGPGLFTWVVRDHFRTDPRIELELYGYDHAPRMAELAISIWNRLEEDTHYTCFHSIEELCSVAILCRPAPCNVLVTFGHVLIQTNNDESAFSDFVAIVRTFAALGACQILAVDARSKSRRQKFRTACKHLTSAIEQHIPSIGSSMSARIRVKE